MDHILYISEQHKKKKLESLTDYLKSALLEQSYQKLYYHNSEMACFRLNRDGDNYLVDTNYFVGVDWLVSGKAAVYVEPKLNHTLQVDFLGMLIQSLNAAENIEHLEGLCYVDYDNPWIRIPEQKDYLSPILIVQFLKLVQRIVRKGLKKSYYRVTENLNGRIKGKILIGAQIKENILKNRIANTICNYQEYGINTRENQFLRLVLTFVSSYLSEKSHFFDKVQVQQLNHILSYCMPAFQHVDILHETHMKVTVKPNVFYKEHDEAIKIGSYILKRFSFNISKTSQNQASTPPFWIDMSKLFELYVFEKLKKLFPEPGALTFHDNFIGRKQTDILIRKGVFKCVIDCKYKPQYLDDSPSLEDKRQLAGYTRLKSVYDKLEEPYDRLIKGLIIYSHQTCPADIEKEDLFSKNISEYIEFYKLGIRLPEIPIP